MKNVVFVILISLIVCIACAKKEMVNFDNNEEVKVHYDTVAIDSFSSGAISVDVARKIKISSLHYRDSIKEALKIQTEEKRIKQELDKENKKKQDDEKKKKALETSSHPVKIE